MIDEIPKILNKFSTNLKDAINIAFSATQESGTNQLSSDFLLYGLASQKGGIAAEILKNSGLKLAELEVKIIKQKDLSSNANLGKLLNNKNKTFKKDDFVSLTEDTENLLLKAFSCANKHNHKFIGTEHLLWAILQIKKCQAFVLLRDLKCNLRYIEEQANIMLKNTEKFADMTKHYETSNKKNREALRFYCSNICDKKILKNFDRIVGREKEIERIINILGRKQKNNPLLVGESGVGKTAIIYGLAKKIFEKKVPGFLKDKKIFKLDSAKLIAGTVFRGEFEMRLKALIDELAQNKNVILFIDEINSIISMGQANGAFDAGSILKPAMSSSNLQIICTSSFADYKKTIENDNSLVRRFQLIKINEPNEIETMKILKGIRANFEKFHRTKISDDAIESAVYLSKRYLHNRFLPDKAIDVLDETLSRHKIEHGRIVVNDKLLILDKKLDQIKLDKERKVKEEKFKEALVLKREEIAITEKIYSILDDTKIWPEIFASDIAKTLSLMTDIPLDTLVTKEKEKLLNLENILGKKVIGQEQAIELVAKFIRRARAGISSPNRPIGSFLFLGPTGVGKTELAKVLAMEVFGNIDDLIRIDMSEFSEKFNISKLIGAPAGYIGYEEGGKLTEAVKRKPYAVVLFDEIEKAHPDVFNLFLQVLDDGVLTDAAGTKVDFKNTIIIMTSNTGTKSITKNAVGFGETEKYNPENFDKTYEDYKQEILSDVKKEYRPEFLNRIDRVVIFKPLGPESIKIIIDLQIKELQKRLWNKKIKIAVSDLVKKEIADKGFDFERGARPLRGTIGEVIEDPLAEGIISEKFVEGAFVKIDKISNQVVLKNKV